MKVLVVGGGGREHALAWKLSQSACRPTLYCAPGNPGTAAIGTNVPIEQDDLDGLLQFARRERIDLTVVGPEDPLCAGIVDQFEAAGLTVFGPRSAAARLEGEKAFAKQLMRTCGVPTADARVFSPSDRERMLLRAASRPGEQDVARHVVRAYDLAREYVATREGGIVVKASGLAKGKGVFVCDEPAEALKVLERLMVERVLGDAGETVVIEERLIGREVSLMAMVDGTSIYQLDTAQDYKRLRDGDQGPNTGGMGAYSPAPAIDAGTLSLIDREVFVPVLDGLRRENVEYRGVLYAGLMLTAGGPKVLEFNCRFGDPETQVLMVRLNSDLVSVMEAVVRGRLDHLTLEWDARHAVCVVLAAPGYPDASTGGARIEGLDAASAVPDVHVFHAGTRRDGDSIVAARGRVLNVVALGETLEQARSRAYEAVGRISFSGMQFRTDIGAAAVDRSGAAGSTASVRAN
ncbi:MAG: phosphoribosylamine--glycine ligase [Phycisphaerae bacterium]|nr:phosphoribosylamine--glycine ligase [Phycisphaerae bacterium]